MTPETRLSGKDIYEYSVRHVGKSVLSTVPYGDLPEDMRQEYERQAIDVSRSRKIYVDETGEDDE